MGGKKLFFGKNLAAFKPHYLFLGFILLLTNCEIGTKKYFLIRISEDKLTQVAVTKLDRTPKAIFDIPIPKNLKLTDLNIDRVMVDEFFIKFALYIDFEGYVIHYKILDTNITVMESINEIIKLTTQNRFESMVKEGKPIIYMYNYSIVFEVKRN